MVDAIASGDTTAEAAERLGIPEGTVGTRLRRARARIEGRMPRRTR
jgi:DNA-directed RNA polymerase specialized sigma24 family protein